MHQHRTLSLAFAVLGIAVVFEAGSYSAGQPNQGNPFSSLPPARRPDNLPAGCVARLGCLEYRHPFGTNSVAWSPDGTRIAASSHEGGPLCLYHAATGKLTATLFSDLQRVGVRFSPDGKKLAVSSWASGRGHKITTVDSPENS